MPGFVFIKDEKTREDISG